jgi:ribonuclease HII
MTTAPPTAGQGSGPRPLGARRTVTMKRPRVPATSAARPTLTQERRLWRSGHEWVAGIDEVGRGAWAGPLSVGVAVVRPGARMPSVPKWLRDSKLLTEERREAIFEEVAAWCAAWAVGHASAAECDRWGMTAAQRLATCRALASLGIVPDAVVLDGPYDFVKDRTPQLPGLEPGDADAGWLPLPDVVLPRVVLPMIDADQHCAAVSAASVLAKVVRDRMMRAEAEHFPAYEFERNKGYPSPTHKFALRGYGLSVIHRRSWAFVSGVPWSVS